MRKLTCFLMLLGGSLALQAAEVWRWVDANGVVHYSDVPVQGAEKVDLGARVMRPSTPPASRPETSRPETRSTASNPASYTRCTVASPANDQVFQGVQNIPVTISVAPSLQDGHRVEVQLNGRPVANWPEGALSYALTEVFRGSYTVTARVLDAQKRQVCLGPPISFHVRQPSLLSPARPKAPGR